MLDSNVRPVTSGDTRPNVGQWVRPRVGYYWRPWCHVVQSVSPAEVESQPFGHTSRWLGGYFVAEYPDGTRALQWDHDTDIGEVRFDQVSDTPLPTERQTPTDPDVRVVRIVNPEA